MNGSLAHGMNRRRLWLVQAAILGLITGSLYDIARDKEHWPFSPYRLYPEAELKPELMLLRVVGLTAGEPTREFILSESSHIYPFNHDRLMRPFRHMLARRGGQAQVREGLLDVLARYERRRVAGQHGGPALRGLRLYRHTWHLEPWAKNKDRPDQQELLGEAMQPRTTR